MTSIEHELQATRHLEAWVRTGDPKRFGPLYAEASRWMHWSISQQLARAGHGGRDDIRDIVADCWERLARRDFEALRSFEPQLEGGRGLRAFFSTIAKRRADDYLAKASTRAQRSPVSDPDLIHSHRVHDQIEARSSLEHLFESFQFRSEEQKRRFISLFVHQSSADEEEARSGRSRATIYSWVRDIRTKARSWRSQHETPPGDSDDEGKHPPASL